MVGIAATTLGADALDSMVESLDAEEWYRIERFEAGETGPAGDVGLALVHHGEKDPGGHATWEGDAGFGVVHGAISNRADLGLSHAEVFERVLDRPTVTLPKLSGPFLLAAADRDGTLLVASDKLGTRECYVAGTPDGVAVASDLSAVAGRLDSPEIDVRTAADLLSFGFALGEKTLVAGVESLSPASFLRVSESDSPRAGERNFPRVGEGESWSKSGNETGAGRSSIRRYWEPSFSRLPEEGYVERVLSAYRRAVADAAGTVSGRLGLWLSGGLDSRTMAGVLREEFGPLRTFTYDSNPPDASNLAPARRVADALGVDNDLVVETPDDFAESYAATVRACDGMVPHQNLVAPSFVFGDLHAKVDVTMEAAPQGEFFGEEVWTSHLDAPSAVDAFRSMLAFRRESADDVCALLADSGHLGRGRSDSAPVDPDRSIREMVADSTKSSVPNRVLDVWFRNFPKNAHFRGNEAVRSQVGMRVPFADGDFLDAVAGMDHHRLRRGTVPFTGGRIPRSMSPLKRAVVRRLDAGLDEIPYERTGFAPKRPLALHDAGYVAKQLRWQIAGRPGRWNDWYRDAPAVRRTVNHWLDSARDRPLFDGDFVKELRRQHLAGETDRWGLISGILNLEVWMEQTVDRATVTPRLSRTG
ncbi:asparagine synthase-related protein [Halorussus salinisoli]|uniref:asparagine synthase-related protein n=1 Tax=Halorussus salinisoli TaxID=2558242 RepID=UPI0010C18025|nr:asparagine synthase-related protein [Halorussus salinisoli]